MKTIFATVLSLLAAATQTMAATGGEGEGLGLMAMIFIAFGALIVMFQLIPALMLFGGLLKGLFTSKEKTMAGGNRPS